VLSVGGHRVLSVGGHLVVISVKEEEFGGFSRFSLT
jgi:hypothetical protein